MKNGKGMMDRIIAVIAVVLILFTVAMIVTYWRIGGIPDTLVTAVFAACLGEFGFMAWIKNVKERYGDDAGRDDTVDDMRSDDDSGDGSC